MPHRRERAAQPTTTKEMLEQVKQQYEPSLLAERFISTKDEVIRATDIPERLQLRFPDIVLPEGLDREVLGREAEWIFNRAFQHRQGMEAHQHAVVTRIMQVLEFLK